jgi:Rieske Fe-S protein
MMAAVGLGLGHAVISSGCGDGSSVPPGTTFLASFAQFPALETAGKGIYAVSPLGTLLVVRLTDTTATALSADCTHQGCPVGYTSPTAPLICPCHGSRFSISDGAVLMGPAQTPLKVYPATVGPTGITVTDA